jgi:hypothetical protein
MGKDVLGKKTDKFMGIYVGVHARILPLSIPCLQAKMWVGHGILWVRWGLHQKSLSKIFEKSATLKYPNSFNTLSTLYWHTDLNVQKRRNVMKKMLNIGVLCGVALALSGCWKKKQGDADSPAAGKELAANSTTDSKNLEVAALDTANKMPMEGNKKDGNEGGMEEKQDAAKEITDEGLESLESASGDTDGEAGKNGSKKK